MESLIIFLNTCSTESIIVLEFITLLSLLTTAVYFFGKNGIYAMIILTMIVANLQVLKIVEFGFYPEPIALGKMTICFSFLASDILTEFYGKRSAYEGVYLGFFANISLMLLMVVTVGYAPLEEDAGFNLHPELKTIFTPMPLIFISGIIAFLVSQFLDIHLYLRIKERFQGKYMWLRSFISTVTASLLDNIVFYTFAFYIFQRFVTLDSLIYSYIIGTFIFRVSIVFFSSFIIYIIKIALSRHKNRIQSNVYENKEYDSLGLSTTGS